MPPLQYWATFGKTFGNLISWSAFPLVEERCPFEIDGLHLHDAFDRQDAA
jgi:hypothetical protein